MRNITYTTAEKDEMICRYRDTKSYAKTAKSFGCSTSTIFYAVNPEKYEDHKIYCCRMREAKKVSKW